jgi:hypothetical protein
VKEEVSLEHRGRSDGVPGFECWDGARTVDLLELINATLLNKPVGLNMSFLFIRKMLFETCGNVPAIREKYTVRRL